MTPLVLPPLLDLGGTAVFAMSGALLAARLRQTFVTMVFFAFVTGVGGGSLRDLLIGAPVFWVRDPWVAPVVLALDTLSVVTAIWYCAVSSAEPAVIWIDVRDMAVRT